MSQPRPRIADGYRIAHDAAVAAGWTITVTGGGHLRWQPPPGHGPIFTPSTPSSARGVAKDLCRLRRAGLQFGKAARNDTRSARSASRLATRQQQEGST